MCGLCLVGGKKVLPLDGLTLMYTFGCFFFFKSLAKTEKMRELLECRGCDSALSMDRRTSFQGRPCLFGLNRQSLQMNRMHEFSGHGTNEHAFVFGDSSPIPAFRGVLNGVSFGVFLQFSSSAPDARLDAVAVLVASRDGDDFYLVFKGDFACGLLGRLLLLGFEWFLEAMSDGRTHRTAVWRRGVQRVAYAHASEDAQAAVLRCCHRRLVLLVRDNAQTIQQTSARVVSSRQGLGWGAHGIRVARLPCFRRAIQGSGPMETNGSATAVREKIREISTAAAQL